MHNPRPRAAVVSSAFITAAATALAFAAPAAGASTTAPHRRQLEHRHRVSVLGPSAKHALARIDQALFGKRGSVNVMLQLAPAPAVVPFSSTKAPARALHMARVTAFRDQVSRIHTAQRTVTDRLGQSVTRATTLFTLHNLYDGVAVRTDASRLHALAALPGVVAVHALVPKHLSNAVTVPMIGAPTAWQGGSGGVGADTGTGIKVGIIDTGIDYTHADFGGAGTVAAYTSADADQTHAPTWTPKVAGGFDFAGDSYDPAAGPKSAGGDGNPIADATPMQDPNPIDCSGHGTHVAGTAAGLGVTPDGSTYTGSYNSLASLSSAQYQSMFRIGPGVAPGAALYALKIFGCSEEGGTSSDLISQALDWAADPNGDGDISDHLDVVNMSLGADFTTSEDPDAVAANNASLAGITVVAAAGNAGDEFNAAGAPGDAVRAISVAASDDTTDLVDGVQFSDLAGNQPAEESSAYDWAHGATAGSGFSASLATVGDGVPSHFRAPGDTNNSDGCAPLSPADAAKVAGKIVLLAWTDNDSARRCGSATRTENVSADGALGVVLADDEDEFSAGILGTKIVPTVITTKTATDPVVAAVFGGQNVTATLTYSLHNAVTNVHDGTNGTPDTANAIATFSSRGTGEAGVLKPDISAPGVTVFSALYGSGFDGTSNNGTSMATPHVAGSAALVKAVHPTWTPEQVKAALMNTAAQPVYARAADSAADQSAPMAPERSGAGRVQVDKAVADGVLAYASGGSGAVSVSFGPISTAVTTTLSRFITVQNTTAAPVSFHAIYAAANANPGASYRLTTTTCAAAQDTVPVPVSVPAHSAVLLGVCLTITPSQLTAHPDPTLTLKPTFAPPLDFLNGFERSFISTASGRVVLTSDADSSTLRVPVYAAPRPASTMTQPSSMALSSSGSASLPLSGVGLHPAAPGSGSSDSVIRSTVDAFELQGASGALPICSGSATPPACVPTSRDRAGDLKYVGFTSDGPLYTEYGTDNTFDPWSSDPAGDGSVPPALGYFGIATNWPWPSPDYALYEIWIDINGDGTPDAVLYNTRMPGSDIFVAELASVDSNGVPQLVYDDEFLNLRDGSADTNLFDGDVVTMPFTLAALKQIGVDEGLVAPTQDPSRIGYFVDSLTADAGGVLDSIGDPDAGGRPMTIDAADPGLYASNTHECDDPSSSFVADVCFSTANDDQPGTALTVQRSAALLTDRPLGLLLLHHDDLPGQHAQVVHFASAVSATLAKPAAPYGYRNPLTVHVTTTVGIPPGTVTVTEGATRLASGTLHGGGVVLTLPARSVGKHILTVTYSGSVAHSPSSRAVSLTVTRASTRTTLSMSGTTSATLTATTSIVAPGAGLMSGTIRFYDNGHLFATLRTSGTVRVHRTLTHGRHTLTASYAGGSVLAPSSASRVVSV